MEQRRSRRVLIHFVSVVVDKVPQGFKKRIGDFSDDELSRLEIWIKIIWKDETEKPNDSSTYYVRRLELATVHASSEQRGSETLRRFEDDLTNRMWDIVSNH